MDDTNGADDDSIATSRRSVLAATFALPVVGSVGVGAADTIRRLTDDDLASADSIGPSADAADVTVDFAGGRHPIDDELYTQITMDPELLDALGLSIGDQVRLHRGEDDRALYTVAAAMTEGDASTVRMNRQARARLDIANTAWAKVGDYGRGCPELLGISDLVDEVFDAVADPVVVSDGSIAEARENGELVEDTAGDGSNLAILAPHGGEIEPHTAQQAAALHDQTGADASLWRAMGYRPDGGAFLRWHVPSYAISPASFPALSALLEDQYDYAVSFHGICTNGIRVGGGAPEGVKEHVVDAINYHLPTGAARAELANGRFSARDPDTVVNRASDNGVWIGQPVETREAHADAVVDAVANAVEDWT
jgi:phage replication-related protein YjqB (UPF0714/DUF867 family)